MKKLILLFACVALAAGTSRAQLIPYETSVVFANKAYANSQVDTSGETGSSTVYRQYLLGAVARVTYRLQYGDSINSVSKFRYRVLGNTTWTAVAAVSADTTVDTGTAGYKEIVLRDNTTERVPGQAVELLIIQDFLATGNSANSGAKYTGRLHYR